MHLVAVFDCQHQRSRSGYTIAASGSMTHSRRREFDAVDRATHPNDFVRYLDTVRRTDLFQEIKRRTLAAMDLHNGDIALDIGCGTGEDVSAMAVQVAPAGLAIGVDISATMIATARLRAHEAPSSATFVQGDVFRLPFGDGSVDAIRMERLLQHTREAEVALGEIVRVANRGGRIVAWEGDLDLFVVDAPDYDASRVLQRFVCDQFLNGAIGHRLYGMFLDAGLADVQSAPLLRPVMDLGLIESAFDLNACLALVVDRGLLEQERANRWIESLRSAARAGRFFSAVGGFITSGRKE